MRRCAVSRRRGVGVSADLLALARVALHPGFGFTPDEINYLDQQINAAATAAADRAATAAQERAATKIDASTAATKQTVYIGIAIAGLVGGVIGGALGYRLAKR